MATDSNFPKPYVNSVKAEDSLMKRVPMQHTGIGATPAGMPKGMQSEGMSIEHVGGTATGRK